MRSLISARTAKSALDVSGGYKRRSFCSSISPSSSSSAQQETPSSLSEKLRAGQSKPNQQTSVNNNNNSNNQHHQRQRQRRSQSLSTSSDSSSSSPSSTRPTADGANRRSNRVFSNNNNRTRNGQSADKSGNRTSRSNSSSTSSTSISPIPSVPLPASLAPKTPWNSIFHSLISSQPVTSPPTYPSDQPSLNSKAGFPCPDLTKKPLREGRKSLRLNPLSMRGQDKINGVGGVRFQNKIHPETMMKDGGSDSDSLVGLEKKIRELKLDETIGGDYSRFQSSHLLKLLKTDDQANGNGNGNGKGDLNGFSEGVALALQNNTGMSPEAKLWLMNAIQTRTNGNGKAAQK